MRIPPEVAPISPSALISALTAAALAGCSSWATQTKVTATGGAYTLFANTRGGVAEAAQDALAGITQACGGPYEIVSIELLTEANQVHGSSVNDYYLGLDGAVSFGPFRTALNYECRAAENPVFNDRVQRIAATAGPPRIARPENVMAACQMDSDCDPGLICYEGRCRR